MSVTRCWKPLLLIGLATAVMVVAVQMSQAERRWIETTETTVEGNKGDRAMVGAASGGVLGGLAAMVVGGFGVVAMGTGIGAPAGAALIAIASAIGAGGGAVVGAASGTSDSTLVTETLNVAPAYQMWQWLLLIAVSVVLYGWAIREFRAVGGQADIGRLSG